MSQYLACALNDRIAAVASVGGSFLEDERFNCNPGRAFPVLHMHGTEDPIVPYDGTFSGVSADSTIQFWLANNGCTMDSTVTAFDDINPNDGSTVTSFLYENCDANTEVLFYRMDDGGHVWPGVPFPSNFGNSNFDISGSSEIWNFFNRHSLPEPPQPQLLEKTITVDGLEREYLLYVPAAYDGTEAWPLVINMHGYFENPQRQVELTGMNAIADTAHFLIAYPAGELVNLSEVEGLPEFIPPQGPGWNLGGDISANNDVTFLATMLDTISAEFSVDEARIYSTGLSMGGIMSYMLACQLSDRIAAIAPVAASMLPPEGQVDFPCAPSSPVAVLQIHGTNDILDEFGGSAITIGVNSSLAFWRNQNNCAADSIVTNFPDINTDDQSTVTSIQYNTCDQGTEVWLYRVNDGGHNWPGGAPLAPGFEIFGPVNRDINASSEIWNFFNRHELSESTSVETVTPATFNLRVFPNPASTQVTFSFALPQSARVQLTLHNAIGQRVQTLHDGQLPQGEQQFTWQRDGLPQGTYFYRLRVNDQITSAPLILVR